MLHPFYDNIFDSYVMSPYHYDRYYLSAHQGKQLEQARRAKEIERYRIWKEQQARQKYEARRQQQLERERMMMSVEKQSKEEVEPNYAIVEQNYAIVRGKDGRLYRILLTGGDDDSHNVARNDSWYKLSKPETATVKDKENMKNTKTNIHGSRKERNITKDTKDERLTFISTDAPNKRTTPSERSATLQIEKMKAKIDNSVKEIIPKEDHRAAFAVTVEDASDSENEDDNLHSIWCNRQPSPGQWMEPVFN